jgi:hypothetical protein
MLQQIKTVKQVLKNVNYIISWNFSKVDGGVIKIHNENKEYKIKWNEKTKSVESTYGMHKIKCDKYAASCVAKLMVYDILADYNYPIQFLDLYYEGNPSTNFFFEIISDDNEFNKEENLQNLFQSVINDGLLPEHVALAVDNNIWFGGLNVLVENMYGITTKIKSS